MDPNFSLDIASLKLHSNCSECRLIVIEYTMNEYNNGILALIQNETGAYIYIYIYIYIYVQAIFIITHPEEEVWPGENLVMCVCQIWDVRSEHFSKVPFLWKCVAR